MTALPIDPEDMPPIRDVEELDRRQQRDDTGHNGFRSGKDNANLPLTMLKGDWEAYVAKKGFVPGWPPDHRHNFVGRKSDKE